MVVRLGELLTAVLFCLATSLSQRVTASGEISVSERARPRRAMRAHMGEIELSSVANAKESSSSGVRAHPEFIKSSVSSGPMWRVEANLAESLHLSGCSDTHDWHDGMTNVSDLDANAALYTEEQILEHGHPGLYLSCLHMQNCIIFRTLGVVMFYPHVDNELTWKEANLLDLYGSSCQFFMA